MINRIKQEIKEYFTAKQDALYRQELDAQIVTYDTWIRNREKETREQDPVLVWDKERLWKSIEIVSFCEIGQKNRLKEKAPESRQEKEVVILAEDADRVTEEAAAEIWQVFADNPETVVVYTDEDEVNHSESCRMNPWWKPEYSYDTLLSYFYFGNLVAVRREVLHKAWQTLCKTQKFSDTDVDKEYKKFLYWLMLELCSRLKRSQVCHLSKVLYSSHGITYWGFEAAYQQLREKYDSCRERDPVTGVSVIIPSKDNPEILARCLQSIVHWTRQMTYEILVVDNGSCAENKEKLLQLQKEYGFSYLYEPMKFNFSRMCNLGAARARYEMLLFLNDDCEVRNTGWMAHMANLASVKTTGAVGAKLYYPKSRRLQHCGIYNLHLGPVHKLQFREDSKPYYDRRNLGVRNVLAVTAACLMVRKCVFDHVQGFEESLEVAFNDVDLCWKLYEAGWENVVDNTIFVWHHESISRGSDDSPAKMKRLMEEKKLLYHRHSELWGQDPYYHSGFTTDILDTGYSFAYEYPEGRQLAVEKPEALLKLPEGSRRDECVAVSVEYAGDLQGWFLDPEKAEEIARKLGTKKAVYLQGSAVVLGSDNAVFSKRILLHHEETDGWYEISPDWKYRPDIFVNLPDQRNAALSGFACLADMRYLPEGSYEVGILVSHKFARQNLLRVTTRKIVI